MRQDIHLLTLLPFVRRIVSSETVSLFFGDVVRQRTIVESVRLYRSKINAMSPTRTYLHTPADSFSEMTDVHAVDDALRFTIRSTALRGAVSGNSHEPLDMCHVVRVAAA